MNSSPAAVSDPVLQVKGLTTRFHTGRGTVHAVEDVSFDVRRGETLGLVGESGSGKSVTAMSLLNLVRQPGRIEAGSILFRGRDILALSNKELRGIRGNGLSMVFQDPMSSLNPIMRIGDQITEAIHGKRRTNKSFAGPSQERLHPLGGPGAARAGGHPFAGPSQERLHPLGGPGEARGGGATSADARERAVQLMKLVGIPDPALRLADYPHRFSGGMRQRVMIAMALANEPDVIIADEPTTALDVTVQAQILDVLADINHQLGTAIILITHNLGVVARSCDRVAVMYAGRIVEQARTTELFADPRHPYTQALLAATPRLLASRAHALMPIEGQPPNLTNAIPGCAFAPRCQFAHAACERQPPTTQLGDRGFACWRTAEGDPLPPLTRRAGQTLPTAADARDGPGATHAQPVSGSPLNLLEVRDLVVRFAVPSASLNPFAAGRQLHAVDGVSFTLGHAETVGLVGESGCGKSSLGKALMGINPVAAGQVVFDGRDVTHLRGEQRQWVRRQLQMVFQDPMSALNPRMTVGDALAEPLIVHGLCKGAAQVQARVAELMQLVGLDPAAATRYPHEFSGGQRQRICIARALALRPKIIVADESVSALDVSVRGHVLDLMLELQEEMGLAYLFISHDMAVIERMSHHVAVMRGGEIVETGTRSAVFEAPQHPYTRALLDAVPRPIPPRVRQDSVVQTGPAA